MSNPWPCWTCRYLGDVDTTGFHSCTIPLQLTIWEQWKNHGSPSQRTLGTTMAVSGQSKNEVPSCPVWEQKPDAQAV